MHSLQRYIFASLAVLLSLGLLLFATTIPALAHAKVISATPGIGSTISTAPTTITVEAAENINPDPKLSNLFAYSPNGELISQGDAKVSLNNPKEMSVQIKPQGAGIYVVRWITTSALDGDPDEGAFVFTVQSTPATKSPTGTVSPPVPTTSNGFPLIPVSIASILALLLGLAGGYGLGSTHKKTIDAIGSTQTNQEPSTKTQS